VSALYSATKPNPAQRASGPLSVLLQPCEELSQEELVGLIETSFSVQHIGRSSHDSAVIDVVKYCVRFNVKNKPGHNALRVRRPHGELEGVREEIDVLVKELFQTPLSEARV
jgi:hypothetical protein